MTDLGLYNEFARNHLHREHLVGHDPELYLGQVSILHLSTKFRYVATHWLLPRLARYKGDLTNTY
jgi:hypothetical protein